MVTLDEMRVIRRRWHDKGDPPCNHPTVELEYSPRERTGDYGCMSCGLAWPSEHGKQPPEGWADQPMNQY